MCCWQGFNKRTKKKLLVKVKAQVCFNVNEMKFTEDWAMVSSPKNRQRCRWFFNKVDKRRRENDILTLNWCKLRRRRRWEDNKVKMSKSFPRKHKIMTWFRWNVNFHPLINSLSTEIDYIFRWIFFECLEFTKAFRFSSCFLSQIGQSRFSRIQFSFSLLLISADDFGSFERKIKFSAIFQSFFSCCQRLSTTTWV